MLGILVLAGCGRIAFEPAEIPAEGFGPDGGVSPAGTGVVFQSASQSGSCSSGCNSGASHPITHTLLPGNDRLLVVFSGCGENGTAPSTVTYNGTPMIRLGGLVDYGNFNISGELFYLTDVALDEMTDAAHTVAFPALCYAGIAMQFRNVDQANPIGEFVATGSEHGSSTTISVVTSDARALIVDGVSAGRSGDRQMGVQAPQTERGNVQYNSSSGAGYSASTRSRVDAATPMQRTLAGDSYPFEVHVGAAIHPNP